MTEFRCRCSKDGDSNNERAEQTEDNYRTQYVVEDRSSSSDSDSPEASSAADMGKRKDLELAAAAPAAAAAAAAPATSHHRSSTGSSITLCATLGYGSYYRS